MANPNHGRAILGAVVAVMAVCAGITYGAGTAAGVQDMMHTNGTQYMTYPVNTTQPGAAHLNITQFGAFMSGERLIILGSMHNAGDHPLDSLVIGEITAGNLTIYQSAATAGGMIVNPHGTLALTGFGGNATTLHIVSGSDDAADDCGGAPTAIPGGVDASARANAFNIHNTIHHPLLADAATVSTVVYVGGFSTDEDDLEPLAAGESRPFKIVVYGGDPRAGADDVLNLAASIPFGAEMSMTITGTDGRTHVASDARTVLVNYR